MLKPSHWTELEKSAIAPEVIEANFRSIEGESAVEAFLPHKEWKRRNDGRLSESHLKLYYTFADGGWQFVGDEGSQTCFKPDNPRRYIDRDSGKEKVIKYESVHGEPTGLFIPRVPAQIAQLIAERYDLEASWLDAQFMGLTFWDWVKNQPEVEVLITEGAKKACALISAGYAAIALPGIYNGYRTPKDQYGVVGLGSVGWII